MQVKTLYSTGRVNEREAVALSVAAHARGKKKREDESTLTCNSTQLFTCLLLLAASCYSSFSCLFDLLSYARRGGGALHRASDE